MHYFLWYFMIFIYKYLHLRGKSIIFTENFCKDKMKEVDKYQSGAVSCNCNVKIINYFFLQKSLCI